MSKLDSISTAATPFSLDIAVGVFIFLHGFGDSGRGFASQLPNLLQVPTLRYVLPTAPSMGGENPFAKARGKLPEIGIQPEWLGAHWVCQSKRIAGFRGPSYFWEPVLGLIVLRKPAAQMESTIVTRKK